MVLIHHGLHDHTRGINTIAYGEFFSFFFFHIASAVLRNRQHPARTELSMLINCPSWKLVVRSFNNFFFSTLYFLSSLLFTLASAAKDVFP